MDLCGVWKVYIVYVDGKSIKCRFAGGRGLSMRTCKHDARIWVIKMGGERESDI